MAARAGGLLTLPDPPAGTASSRLAGAREQPRLLPPAPRLGLQRREKEKRPHESVAEELFFFLNLFLEVWLTYSVLVASGGQRGVLTTRLVTRRPPWQA